jgi:hypothetical protein
LDFPEDLDFLRKLLEKHLASGHRESPGIQSVLAYLSSDPELRKMHEALVRPPVNHAFWNSPGIVRDMHSDIGFLSQLAAHKVANAEWAKAAHAYGEIERILKKLQGATQERMGASK